MQEIREVLRCSLGEVTLAVSAPPELHQELNILQSRFKDFRSDELPRLRLTIFKPTIETTKRNETQDKDSVSNLIFKMVRSDALQNHKEHLLSAARRLDLLLSDPAIIDMVRILASQEGKSSFVPLKAGFLFADLSRGEATLILEQACQRDYSGNATLSDITVLNAVMALFTMYLAERRGVIAHGVGVSREGCGYLFLAPSEGGKTTLSMQSPAGSVLADDAVIILKNQKGYHLYPTPFRQRLGGDMASWVWHQDAVPLRALFFLKEGTGTKVETVSRPQALGFMLNSLTHFFLWMNQQQAKAVFDFWRKLSLELTIGLMEWQKGTNFWPKLIEFLNEREKPDEKKEKRLELACGV